MPTQVTFAHPYGAYSPGDTATVSDEDAALLIGSGTARAATAEPAPGLRAVDVSVDAAAVGTLGRATAQATLQALAAELAYLRTIADTAGPPVPEPAPSGAYGSGLYGSGPFGE